MTITQSVRDFALGFPLDSVRARYQRSQDLSAAVALLHERELKRYLLLCATHSDVSLPISPAIDDLWHEFVLHTRDYAAFCSGLTGGFIHHVPMTADDSRAAVAHRYALLLRFYEEEFGESPPADVWRRSGAGGSLLNDCDSDVELADCASESE
ncbi:MAG TPA: hypothetical protein VGP25_18270 [Gemmatimonadaceae bacterium]|jgi:hypothetical protein|nr:hypothetical protein [Gemmatimonadaceae bacterium]